MSQVQLTLPMVEGQPVLPSATKGPGGQPRFRVPLIKELINYDGGVRYLVTHESLYGGYEASSRLFFDVHLEPGDVFVDVGAHFGTFSLSAATRHPGQIQCIAVEPHPLNLVQLLKAVRINSLVPQIQIIAAAAGDRRGIAHLRHASTMGHSMEEHSGTRADMPVLHVPMVTIDELIEARPDLRDRRFFLKIDVEGLELEVLAGARQLLASGNVAAIMWEKGETYSTPTGREKLLQILQELAGHGFSNYRFPSSEFAGPLIPYAPTPELGNVFALAPGFPRQSVYELPFEPRAPFNTLFATPSDPASRAETARLLIEARSSDGARWANPQELTAGAEARAWAAGRHIAPGSRVLDVGAGLLVLKQHLPAGCQYTPADLIARSADCRVIDLNQQQFPDGQYDFLTALEVVEYLHDPAWFFARCAQAAPRLVFTYHPRAGEPIEIRRQYGWFNDLDAAALQSVLSEAGWTIDAQEGAADATLYVCSRQPSGPAQ